MAKAKLSPETLSHLEWLGFVQPTGLVVSATALVKAGAILDRRDIQGQLLLKECVAERAKETTDEGEQYVPDFEIFARQVLGWGFSARYYAGTVENPMPAELEVVLPEYGETLRADYAVREPEPKQGECAWQLLVRVLERGESIEAATKGSGRLEASEHGRMERLLRQTGVLAGLIFNGTRLRLVAAPRGESSGWADFRVRDMLTTAGRPICTAMRLLLSERRLLALPRQERLTALLEDSRKYQNEVSERLAEQVLHALYELLRGFQAADDATKGELLRHQLRERPDEVYHALLTVLLRLVFLLYAEERDMLPGDETFVNYYSIAGLHDRLRADAALYPDTMDQRFGAWAQLLTLFRMVHDGANSERMHLPERHGVLFDPDRFPFLEGRVTAGARQIHERIDAPLVPDGTVFRALEKLLVLDGERISYRALDVEQIGSVYETMMGFRLETAHGRSLAIRPAKRLGAPVTIDLEELLTVASDKREKWFADRTDRKLAPSVKQAMVPAVTVDELHAALESLVDRDATPDIIPPGAMVLQPSEERRRSGSHYTPRSLTEPIVHTALEPLIGRLKGPNGEPPRPGQILDLKVCDPAMGSGAFLVEVCRKLGDELVESWGYYGLKPTLPPDEDEVVFARRVVAQRCLYGVDKNPVAVDLAKMSLWLATLAREHPLTFLDHALRHGDSLIGLSLAQIEAFHWDPKALGWETLRVRHHLAKVAELRELIRDSKEGISDWELRSLWNEAQQELGVVRVLGDLVVAAFFEGSKPKERQARRDRYALLVTNGVAQAESTRLEEWRHAELPLVPFHWEIEFPEVFGREAWGFDAMVGNPPFMGGSKISTTYGMPYFAYLSEQFPPAGHQCDLVGYFFRRAFDLLSSPGTFGLIATKTVAQGDTREGSLLPILARGGHIYSATRRLKWPGMAAVTVSPVHVAKGIRPVVKLDGTEVERISAYLVPGDRDTAPMPLSANPYFSKGSQIYGQGFTFDDTDAKANSIATMNQIIASEPQSSQRVFSFIGGEELNSMPVLRPSRYVAYFSDVSEEGELECFPRLAQLIRERVKPERDALGDNPNNTPLKRRWWAYQAHRPELYERLRKRPRVLAHAEISAHLAFQFVPTGWIYNKTMILVDLESYASFAVLQSRVHEGWVRFTASTLEDRLGYRASDCFATFPFPTHWDTNSHAEDAGRSYYEFRANLMIRNNEGLTKTYNRFHDPEEDSSDILKLRELHETLDRAVLDAYGWTDIPTACEFLLDYEEDEEEAGNKKKPWRYRWPDDVRDEVLARLLELNAQRAAEEALAGAGAGAKKGRAGKKSSGEANPNVESLF